MQNKGFIKFIAILFALVCLFHLSFTYVTSRVVNKADEYAHNAETERLAGLLADGDATREQLLYDSIAKARESYYLDSMSGQIVYNIPGIRKYTFSEVRERELNLGLDLKGGMNVTLEVSVVDIIKGLSGNSQNPVFLQALQLTREKQKDSQEGFVTLFGEAINEIDPNFSLASIFINEFKDQLSFNSTNDEVISVIKSETNAAIDRTFNILRTRIDRFGVAQPNIQKLQTTGRILVELPGIKEPERVRKLLQGTAQLEFWETYNFSELQGYFGEANKKLVDILKSEKILDEVTKNSPAADRGNTESEELETVETETIETDSTGTDLIDQFEQDSITVDAGKRDAEFAKNNPLYAYLVPNYIPNQSGGAAAAESSTVGYAQVKDTAMVNSLLRKVKDVLPRDLKLAWGIKESQYYPDHHELYALKVSSRDGSPALEGDVIVDAGQNYDQTNRVVVDMSMNSDGARVWKRLTGDNIGRQIAIVLDDYVYSAPNVNDEIPTGRSQISGNFEVAEAQDLANILKAGKLPAPARIVEEAVVGPSLGKVAISNGLNSFVIAFLLVLLYMWMYYNKAGWVADLALLTNIFFIFGVLASLGAVLTLPGIAGIVLTLGMAVDANVIIFERIKEEIRAGKGMRLAISDGYKNAYSAIIDGNVTTLLTGIVLYTFGSGPVQGFATTLIIGIVSSLFSAIFISRLIFNFYLEKNKTIPFGNKFTNNTFANANYDFLGMRKIAYIVSGLVIILGIGSLATRGLNYGVDFSGGRTYVIRFDQAVVTSEIRNSLELEFDQQPEVKTFGPNSQVKITTKFMIDDIDPSVDSIIQAKLFQGLKPFYQDQNLAYKDFVADTDEGKLIGILSSQKVGPTIADDIRNRAYLAVIFALIVIFIYIAIRFKKWQYGLSGVVALFHDTLITISLFSLFYNILPFNLEIDQAFIAAILTIIGYSINDSVIIFDRIREYVGLHPKRKLKDNINNGLNSTLARTVNTSGTTLVVLLIIFIFGGDVIRGFTFALLMGVLVGTYSSVFVASPIAYDLLTSGGKNDEEKVTIKKNKK